MKNIAHLIRGAALCLATFALHAQAQTAAPPPAPGAAPAAAAKMVSRDELRTCMNSESELGTRRQALTVRNEKAREEAAAIRAEAQQLAEEQKKAEDDPSRMERFNRRVKAHNTRLEAANAALAAFRADAEALNQSLNAYNKTCGGITFRSEDREAILKEREAGKK